MPDLHAHLAACIDALPPGSWFIDIGANVGDFTLRAAARDVRVLAFEPSLAHRQQLLSVALSRNLNLAWVSVLPVALGNTVGSAELAVTNDGNPGWNTIIPGFMPSDRIDHVESVPVARLDDLASWIPGDQIGLIKVDVEGYELPVIEGAQQTLSRCSCPVIIEVAPAAYPLLGRQPSDLTTVMGWCGYTTTTDPTSLRSTSDTIWAKR